MAVGPAGLGHYAAKLIYREATLSRTSGSYVHTLIYSTVLNKERAQWRGKAGVADEVCRGLASLEVRHHGVVLVEVSGGQEALLSRAATLNEVERQGVRPMLLLTALEGALVMTWLFLARAVHRSRPLTSA